MVSESVAQGASLPRGVGACIHTLPESVVSLIPWRPRCSEEAAVPVSGQSAVKEALFRREGRLLYATTDWRILCRPISSIPAVRQLSAGKGVGRGAPSSGSPQGAEGGRWKTSTATAACIERARRAGEGAASRVVRSGAQGKRPTRGGRKCENALELRGRAPADSPDQAMNGALRAAGAREVGLCPEDKHTGQKETALWARWGAHRERVDADA